MRPYILMVLCSATLASLVVGRAAAAPPKEERTVVESGVGVFYSPDGKWIAFKSELLRLGAVPATRAGAKPTFDGNYSHAAFTPDSKFLVAFDADRKLQFINVATGKAARTIPVPFKNPNDIAQSVAVSHDGKKIAVTALLGGAMVFDAAKGADAVPLEKCIAHALTFSKDDATVVGFDGDGRISIWDAATGKQTKAWNVWQRDIVRCAFGEDGKLAAAAEADTGIVRLWDMEAGKELGVLKHPRFVHAVALTRDGKTLAVSCSEPKGKPEVKLWDVTNQKELDGIKDLPSRALGLSFSPDGKFLLVANQGSSTAKAATKLFSLSAS